MRMLLVVAPEILSAASSALSFTASAALCALSSAFVDGPCAVGRDRNGVASSCQRLLGVLVNCEAMALARR